MKPGSYHYEPGFLYPVYADGPICVIQGNDAGYSDRRLPTAWMKWEWGPALAEVKNLGHSLHTCEGYLGESVIFG